jgi:hypothetical protein
MEPEGSLPYSQVPANCPYHDRAQSSPYPLSHFLKIHLNPLAPNDPWAPGPVWTCAENLAPTGNFFICSYLVLYCSGIGLSMVVCIVSYCMLWIFPAGKIRRLRSGANPRSWVPEASMQTPRPPKTLDSIPEPSSP